jgi:hypothetical protein
MGRVEVVIESFRVAGFWNADLNRQEHGERQVKPGRGVLANAQCFWQLNELIVD